MRPLLRLLSPHRALFIASIFTLMLAAFFNSGLTALITSLIDNVMTDQGSGEIGRADKMLGLTEKLAWMRAQLEAIGLPAELVSANSETGLVNPLAWSMLAMFLFLSQATFEFVGTYTLGKIGLNVVVELRQKLMDRVMSLSLNFFQRFSSGELLARVNTDVLRVQQAISNKMAELFKESANALVFLVWAFVLDWKLSLTLFLLVPLVGYPIATFSRKIRKFASRSQAYLGNLTAHLKEVLVGIRIVKGFQKEDFESSKLAHQNKHFLKNALSELKIVAMTTPVMGILGMVIILGFVTYGSMVIQRGEMTAGDFFFYVIVIYQLYQPIKRIARANSEIQQAVGVLPRIEEVLTWENEIVEPKKPLVTKQFAEINGIRFTDVGFHYPDTDPNLPVLTGINMTIEPGEVVALVGPSGSGKSTMVNLLPRFFDVIEGQILINGADIRNLAKADLRALMAIVTQDTILFDDTVHNNIAYGEPNCSRERVEEAARQAFASTFINELPKGFETMIGESGSSLSGGQRQRLSIARAILKNAPILILDEATSALDTESEREVQLALENLMKTKTTLVIAHRLSTIRQAHKIIVLNQGRIIERGNHESLLAAKGFYYRLIQMQEEGLDAL